MAFIYAGIDHVQLAAPEGCEAEARRFFTGILNWVEVPKPENLQKRGGVWFQCGIHQVHIGVQLDFTAATKAHPAFKVHHLQALRDYLLQQDVIIMDDEQRAEEGISRFYINDPFGNRLEFLETISLENKARFTNRVEDYVKYRPSYPPEAINYLYETIGIKQDSQIADIGAGTGIFSQLLLARGSHVTAVEPNQAMREAAEKSLAQIPSYTSVTGSAEETTLPTASMDYIVTAQAFHWFNQTVAQTEFRRVLKPSGKAILIWNNRLRQGNDFLEEYELLLRKFGTDYEKVQHTNITEDALRAFFKFGSFTVARFKISQEVDFVGLCGRILSSSYIPALGHPSYEPMMIDLKSMFERNKLNGKVSIDYVTEVYWGEM